MDSLEFRTRVHEAFQYRDLTAIAELRNLAVSRSDISIDKDLVRELMDLYASYDSDDTKDTIVDFMTALAQRSGHKASKALFFPSDTNYNVFVSKLRSARSYCYVAVYTITNNEIAAILYDLHSKGVEVRVLTDDETLLGKGSDVGELAKWGVTVRRDDNLQARLHHKFAVIDDVCVINGSFNWTFAAYRSNYENMVIAYEPKLIQDFKTEFLNMWQKLAKFELPRGSEEVPYRYKKFISEGKKKW